MRDNQYILFLQWALPRLNLRWRGFRKVRRQVCKRISSRITELELESLDSYKRYLMINPEEWAVLDHFCRITISRFYRDPFVYDHLFTQVLPALINTCFPEKNHTVRVWSAGCASGEEPYTISIGWQYAIQPLYPDMKVRIVATDIDPVMLERAIKASYQRSSLRMLPGKWQTEAFIKREEGNFILHRVYKDAVRFELLDIREEAPDGLFEVILCRNLAFTYFDHELQQEVLRRTVNKLAPGGILITGGHEELPDNGSLFVPWARHAPIYRKTS